MLFYVCSVIGYELLWLYTWWLRISLLYTPGASGRCDIGWRSFSLLLTCIAASVLWVQPR